MATAQQMLTGDVYYRMRGIDQLNPRMHQFHMYPATMGQMTCQSLPCNNNLSAFTKPQSYVPASCLPSMCPDRRMPDGLRHPYFHGTLRGHYWPFGQTFRGPMETSNTVHYQQGQHYHHPPCHMNFYNCCAHVWRSVDHYYPQSKRPRMAEDNLLEGAEGTTDPFGKRIAMHQNPKKKETAAHKPLPSPPPLIRTCVNQKESKHLHLKKLVERKAYENDDPEGYLSENREPSKMQVPVADYSTKCCEISRNDKRSDFMHKFHNERNTDVKQHNQTFIGSQKFESVPRNGNLNGKSTLLNNKQKGCKKSNTPDVEKKLCSNKNVGEQMEQHLPLQHCVECFHMVTGENALHACQARALGKKKQCSVNERNANYRLNKRRHSHYALVPQEGHNTQQDALKRSLPFPITEQLDSSENSDDFYETKTTDHNREYVVPLFKDYRERKTEAPKHLNQNGMHKHLSDGTIHPQLKYYPPDCPQPNTNGERNRSKSFDATKMHTSTSQSLCHKLQLDNFFNQTKIQSEVPCEPVLGDKSVGHGNDNVLSPTISGRYRHNDEIKVNFVSSNDKEPAEKAGHYPSVSYENSSANLSGLASNRKEELYQTAIVDQAQATMNTVRMLQQQPNVSKRRYNSVSSMPHFQPNQPRSSDNTSHTSKYLDTNQMGVSTHCDVLYDQGKKLPHVANNQATNARKVRQFGNVMSPASPNGSQIRGPINFIELLKRRTALPQDHIRSNDTRPNMRRVSNYRREVNDQSSHDQEAEGEPKLHQKKVSSASRPLTPRNSHDIETQNHEVKISVASNHYSNSVKSQTLKDQAVDQPTPQSPPLPPLPSGKDLDRIDSGCGGYAIDHNALPRIVAVHSIVTNNETLQEEEADLFSVNDKKCWKDLLHKLTSDESESNESKSFKIPQADVPEIDKVDDPKDIEYQLENDSTMEQESRSYPNAFNKANKWTLWKYLSSPSKDLTIEIKCPTDCDEMADAKKKTQPVRRKLTVRELRDKILYTRERIKKELIPWKKKLLVSLEATFIKRLRKTEKETGEKADSLVLKQNEDDDDCKETVEKKKCHKQGRKRKTLAKS